MEKKIKSECDFIEFKNNRLNCKCKECVKIWCKSLNGLIKDFSIMNQFCKGDINNFLFLLRKGVYPYEYMDSWESFNETSLLDKIYFYSELNNEDISDKDYEHYKNIQEVFEIKNLGEYHDLYVQCNTLLLEMYLKTLETSVLKYMDLILLIFCLHQDQHGKPA